MFFACYINGKPSPEYIIQNEGVAVVGIPSEHTVYVYIEGDVTVVECSDSLMYRSELTEFAWGFTGQ